jgi:hypothetical protein
LKKQGRSDLQKKAKAKWGELSTEQKKNWKNRLLYMSQEILPRFRFTILDKLPTGDPSTIQIHNSG